MKLWKILLATMIALLLVSAVALADEDECDMHIPSTWIETKAAQCDVPGEEVRYICSNTGCPYAEKKEENVLQRRATEPLAHWWKDIEGSWVDAATCGEKGYKIQECTRKGCDAERVVYEDKAKEHTPSKSAGNSKPATCDEDGYDFFRCLDCGASWTEVVKATGHDFSIEMPGVPANCYQAGHTGYEKCSKCDATQGKYPIAINDNHTNAYRVPETSKAATCTEAGWNYFTCTGCHQEWKVTIPATGDHAWETQKAKPATCTEDGYTGHEKCATCGALRGYVVIPASGAEHKWSYNGKADPTCDKEGYKNDICTVCGDYRYYDYVAAKGHDYSVLTKNTDPTCEKEGERIYACANGCGKTDTVKVAKIAHNYAETEWEVDVPATCVLPGTEKNHCTMCDAAWVVRETKPLGHKLSKDTVWKLLPTCLEDGVMVKLCERDGCGYEETTIVEAYGHKEKDEVVAAPDCVNVGMKHVKCERGCGYIAKNVIIPAKGHKGEVTEYVAPTCTTAGKKTTKCENCNQTVTETLAKLPHDYEWVTTPATPSANGKSEYKCACGDVKETKTIKYTKWYYNNTMTSFGPTTKELVGGNDWYRVTPVDLAVDGVYTYDLIASNKYVVGTVTISVNAGTLSVSYKAQHGVEVKDEALLIYASKADLAAGSAVTAAVGSAINTAETFGEDTKVLVSLILTGNYDAAGKNYVDADAASALAANID